MCTRQQINTLRFIRSPKLEKEIQYEFMDIHRSFFDEQKSTTDFTPCHHENSSRNKSENDDGII
jgi:hypothetical protein